MNEQALKVCYFAPNEVSNLLVFPATFTFPEDVSLKSAWAAAGNSLHVDAAAAVIRVALDDLASKASG